MAKLFVGDKMPNFTFQTESETGVTTEKVLQDGRTVFWVLRYIGCTTCRWDVHQISLNYDKFKEKGVQVYVVMQSDPAVVREDLKDSPIPFHIICDQDQEIYKTLEIRATETREERQPKTPEDIAKWQAKIEKVRASGFVHGKYEGNEQQLPAMFVVDPDGTVIYAHYAENSIDMPSVDEMLEILDGLK
ncbi:MAG: AhpC/TSA family protein [Oscillospiraceae bacterium]|nr:AhpC/TSA family protein [Oscillospiraceae bacterium]MBQ2791686.1 AhpC/TSA family protein [Oscillospiraceae bacterium]MBR6608214.1 AhpC/TSA family protein [Oscillospiraceae bacterium]